MEGLIRICTLSHIQTFRPAPAAQGYRLGIHHQARYIDERRCVQCGLCYQVCPARDRAIRRATTNLKGPRFSLSDNDCLHFQGRDCQACLEVCPVDAIDFSAPAVYEEIDVRAVVVAVGFTPFDPRLKPRYGFGRLPDVVTALELERQLRIKGQLTRPSDGLPPGNMAFIQCVGSRDHSLGRDYCSRVCCAYALRMARLIRHRWPETGVSVFYMDIQNFGRDFGRYFREVQDSMELIHGLPGEISAAPEGGLLIPFYNEINGQREHRIFDLIVLSIGLGPPDNDLAECLGIGTDGDGFFTPRSELGIFVAGAASGPMNVAESRSQSLGVATSIQQYLASHP